MTERPEQPAERSPVDTGAVFREQLPVIFAELAAGALMLGVYGLLGRLTMAVCLGAALGTAAALLNFAAMIFSLLKAEGAENPAKGQLMVRGMFMLRMLVLILAMVAALKSGYFDPIATLLPLILMRLAIFAAELIFRKKKKKGDASWTSK
ncbi:MAG: ATP synthase subunit I [Oscillospiraceae bacterium]|nr:ATP synthase subunit I [Oscillospiraceae bacterium]